MLFKAYDLDESGELSRSEFLGIEMRLCFEHGGVFKAESTTARMTMADRDSSGSLDYEEFRTRFLTNYQELGMSRKEIVAHVTQEAQLTLQERAKMGPRFHAGIRQALRQIFSLFDVSGDGLLSPEEWIAAQKAVAVEVTDDLDEGWIEEAAFTAADVNGDGQLDLNEFMEASFNMFEGIKKRTEQILGTLQRIITVLEQQRLSGRKETLPVMILVQSTQPDFQPPHSSWQEDGHGPSWESKGEVVLPLSLATVEDVASLLRLHLHLPLETWFHVYFLGVAKEGGPRPVTLLRGERPGEGNVQAMLQYLSKPNAELKLFVKNVRKRPTKLVKQPRAFLEEREGIMQKRIGQQWGLDWETQLVGLGSKLPPRPFAITLGEALVIEVPQTDDAGEYRYVANVYMDRTDVLSKPVDENIVPVAKGKKKKGPTVEPDPLLQLSFVCLKEGKCVLFVDLGWEDQEEKLAARYSLLQPIGHNSVARIGPLEVEVIKAPAGYKAEKDKFSWWNGEKWSNKKGPAKKKGKK